MSRFYALLNRMKFIGRWGLMRSTRQENIAEHSHNVAMIAHALAVIDNRVFGKKVDANRVGMIAVFHETSEVLTGDLPTPIKYFNRDIMVAYKSIEEKAENKLIDMLPFEMKLDIRDLVQPGKDSYEYKLVKYADRLAAYIKCIEEMESGNMDYAEAKISIQKDIYAIDSDCLRYFMDNFMDAYFKTLDETAQ